MPHRQRTSSRSERRVAPFPVSSVLINQRRRVHVHYGSLSCDVRRRLHPEIDNSATATRLGVKSSSATVAFGRGRRGLIKYLTEHEKGPRESQLRPLEISPTAIPHHPRRRSHFFIVLVLPRLDVSQVSISGRRPPSRLLRLRAYDRVCLP